MDRATQILQVIETHKQMVAAFEKDAVDVIGRAVDALVKALRAGKRIYVCGNGGSAADAQHIAGELVGRFERTRAALPAVALTTDTSILTSIGNDLAFDQVFVRQVEALVCAGDVLWAISTSGTSPNVVQAADLARKRGAVILAFTGRPNTPLEGLSHVCLVAENRSTARSQEIHQIAYHIICGLVEQAMADRDS